MLTEEEVLDSVPDLYNLEYWPRDDFSEIKGFKMKSSEEEGVNIIGEATK